MQTWGEFHAKLHDGKNPFQSHLWYASMGGIPPICTERVEQQILLVECQTGP